MKTIYESFLELNEKVSSNRNEIDELKEKYNFESSMEKLLHMDLKLDYDKLFEDLKNKKSYNEKNKLLSNLEVYKKKESYIQNYLDSYYEKIKGL